MNIVGIDPGKNGAIVVLNDGSVVFKAVMPCIGKEFSVGGLYSMINEICFVASNCHFFIEDVHALYGSAAGATFQFGYVCGCIRGVVVSCGKPYTLVQPKKWQKEVYQGVPEIRKPGSVVNDKPRRGNIDTKKMSELAAQRLFPGVDLRKTSRCTINHDGIVDALLIAEYGRRTLK